MADVESEIRINIIYNENAADISGIFLWIIFFINPIAGVLHLPNQ